MSGAAAAYVSLLLKCQGLLKLCLPESALSFVSGGAPTHRGLRRFLSQHFIPEQSEWVRVQYGLAEGMWINISLATERTWWLGTHEPATQEKLGRVLGPGRVLYDVGAHIGFYTLPAARLGAEVIAFEPDPESAARIRAHVDRNGLQNKVQIVQAAVWSISRPSITFRRGWPRSQGGISWGHHQPVIAKGEIIEVATLSLDDVVAGGCLPPHVIKIDVEGSESEVLKGAANILHKHRPVLIVEVHSLDEHTAISQILEHAAYTISWDIPREGFPRQCFAVPANPI